MASGNGFTQPLAMASSLPKGHRTNSHATGQDRPRHDSPWGSGRGAAPGVHGAGSPSDLGLLDDWDDSVMSSR